MGVLNAYVTHSVNSGGQFCKQDHMNGLLAALRACIRSKDLAVGRKLHSQAVESGCIADKYVASMLLNMYAKCGSMSEARAVFDSIVRPNAVSWNTLIAGYVEQGECELALELFDRIEAPDSRSFMTALKACGELASRESGKSQIWRKWILKGLALHYQAVKYRFDLDIYVGSTLVDMYSKFGCMVDARMVFDEMFSRDITAWNALLQGYVDNGESGLALELYDVVEDCCRPDKRTYIAALSACASLASEFDQAGENKSRWLEKGKSIHSQATMQGYCDVYLDSALINTYAKCSTMLHAQSVFDRMRGHHIVAWTALLQGYVDSEEGETALQLFDEMATGTSDCVPNSRTYVAVLRACSSASKDFGTERTWLEKGKAIHSQAVMACSCGIFVQSTLIDMYAKLGSMRHARAVFDSMPVPDVVSWNALIQGYALNDETRLALELLDAMEQQGRDDCLPNASTYAASLTSPSSARRDDKTSKAPISLEQVKAIHSQALMNGCCNSFVENVLIESYGRCNNTLHAGSVFDTMIPQTVAAWNALLQGYVQNGESDLCLETFDLMQDEAGLIPDRRTYVAALMACVDLATSSFGRAAASRWLEKGKALHSESTFNSCDHIYVQNTLLNLYARCGSMIHVGGLFERMLNRDVVSWNAVLQGYIFNANSKLALEFFDQMLEYCNPDAVTYLSALTACSTLHRLEKGKGLHSQAVIQGSADIFVQNTLIKMYSACGKIEHALSVFDSISHKDEVSWNCVIHGCLKNGENGRVLKLIACMDSCGWLPNAGMFVDALLACWNLGAIEIGRMFRSEIESCGLEQEVAMATCLMDFYANPEQQDFNSPF